MNKKLIICLPLCLFLNGSFTPIGNSKPSYSVNGSVGYQDRYEQIKDSIDYKLAVLNDLLEHENDLMLAYAASEISHNRKVDSLTALATKITP